MKTNIEMAREADVYCTTRQLTLDAMLERFAALVAAAEREACAKLAEHFGGFKDGYSCAAAIRARGEALAQPVQPVQPQHKYIMNEPFKPDWEAMLERQTARIVDAQTHAAVREIERLREALAQPAPLPEQEPWNWAAHEYDGIHRKAQPVPHCEGYWCADLTCSKCYSADFRFKHTAPPLPVQRQSGWTHD